MSEEVYYRGKLLYFGVCNEENAEEILKEYDKDLCYSCYPSFIEMMEGEIYDYVIIKNNLGVRVIYEIEYKEIANGEVLQANENKDGYDFEVKYYNGGCNLTEVLQEAVNNI